jgi:hypothetical protein
MVYLLFWCMRSADFRYRMITENWTMILMMHDFYILYPHNIHSRDFSLG